MAGNANPARHHGVALPLIHRAGLVAALDRAAEAKVTLISAPAGSGKTSLLRAWAAGPGRLHRLVIVPVQRDQQDSQQFWLAVLTAVRQASGGSGRLAATPDFNEATISDRALSELAENQERTFLLVDDLHELTAPDALPQLARMLERLPATCTPSSPSRRDLTLRLHKLRLAGDLAEIRAADLRFTPEESRELLAASDIPLSEAGTAKLHDRTEGWAAGLRLAALSLAHSDDPERFVAEFSGSSRTVAEYLMAEMLESQPAGGPATAAADLAGGPRQRRARGPADRPAGLGPDPARPGGRQRVYPVARRRTGPGSAITICLPTCSGWSCAAGCPRSCRACTGWPRGGSPSTARSPRPSGTRRPRVTGRTRRGCWPITRSA